jgi:hypothetical protein
MCLIDYIYAIISLVTKISTVHHSSHLSVHFGDDVCFSASQLVHLKWLLLQSPEQLHFPFINQYSTGPLFLLVPSKTYPPALY